MRVLSRAQWRARAEAHHARLEPLLAGAIARRTRGQKHPVEDFLFHYYNLRPSHLSQWHPGVGVRLEDADEHAGLPFYRRDEKGAALDPAAFLAKRGNTVREAGRLLAASAAAAPRFGCFGMHEWAMVYRLEPGQTRHPYLQLRFPPDEIASIVEEVGCRCSHFDAFRFFTPPARPLNLFAPTRADQAEHDQPGCLHVNMDLYKCRKKVALRPRGFTLPLPGRSITLPLPGQWGSVGWLAQIVGLGWSSSEPGKVSKAYMPS